jgi:hypothetical protein
MDRRDRGKGTHGPGFCRKQRVIVVSAHCGNWEHAAAWLAGTAGELAWSATRTIHSSGSLLIR